MITGKTKTEKEYRSTELDSSSSLRDFANDRRKYFKKYVSLVKMEEDEEETKASIMGKLVETLLLEPNEFDNRFWLCSVSKAPTGKMLEFVDALCKKTLENEEADFIELAKEAHRESGFEISLENVLKRFYGSNNEVYYREMLKVKKNNLTIITAEDIETAENIVNELKINQFTSWLFNLDKNRYDCFYQINIENFEIKGLPMKAMIDILLIDKKKKKIVPYDLKCVWAVENFYEEYYLKKKAYIQALVYKEACYHFKEMNEDYSYYDVENLRFLVCDSSNYYKPLIYVLDSDDMEDAYNGFEHKGKRYKGVYEIIDDLLWAKENNIWEISRTNYLNKGFVKLRN